MARSGVTTGSLRCAAVPQAPWTGPTGTAAIDPRYGSGRLGALLRRSSPAGGVERHHRGHDAVRVALHVGHDRIEQLGERLARCDPCQERRLAAREQLVASAVRLVGHSADHPHRLAGGVTQYAAPAGHVGIAPVAAAEAVGQLPARRAAPEGALDLGDDALAVFRVHPLVPPRRRADEAGRRLPEERLDAAAPDDPIGGQVPVPRGVPRGLHHQPVALLALPQRRLGPDPVPDLLKADHEVVGPLLGVPDQRHGDKRPHRLAGPIEAALLLGVRGAFPGQQQRAAPHARRADRPGG